MKAAFVYRLMQFVAWPETTLADARTLDVCVLRPSPFGGELDELLRGETLQGRPLRLREIDGPEDVSGCHSIFAGSRAPHVRDVLRAAVARPILTVGEADDFLQSGGLITLRVVNRRVRFEVDAGNVRKAGLRVDAQLLNLATAVHGGPW